MAFIVLELIRDRHGFVTDVVAVNTGEIVRTDSSNWTDAYYQKMNGRAVQYFKSDELVFARVRDGEPPT